MSQTWDEKLCRLISTRVVPDILNRVLLAGPSQTGKTSFPLRLLPNCLRGTCHKQQPIDDWIGGYCLKDGTTKWEYGILCRAMINGWPIVIDEIDLHSPECKSFFYAALDNPAGLTLPTGERIEANKGYCVFATTNARPDSLPDPIFQRFDIILKCETLSAGLQEALGDLRDVAKTVIARNNTHNYEMKFARMGTLIAASKLMQAGFSGDKLADALGLSDQDAADFLASIANR
jgi:midasin (ATPase involved in ribosome maturation)